MKLTVKFTAEGGDAMTATLDNTNGTVSNDRGGKGTFTYDPATHTTTISADDFNGTVTYANAPPPEIGAVTPYVNSYGQKGLATLVAIA